MEIRDNNSTEFLQTEGLRVYTENAISALEVAGFNLDNCTVDHVGVRVSWGEEVGYARYCGLKNILLSRAEMVSEQIIPPNANGRPIAIFELSEGFLCALGMVKYLELPAPRIGRDEAEVIDHIEIVVPVSLTEYYMNHKSIFDEFCSSEHVSTALESEANNGVNPDITVEINRFKVKFHTKSIEEVIRIQNTMPVFLTLAEQFRISNPGVMTN